MSDLSAVVTNLDELRPKKMITLTLLGQDPFWVRQQWLKSKQKEWDWMEDASWVVAEWGGEW